jgi:hypothetical protein
MHTTLSQTQLETLITQARENDEACIVNLLSWYRIFVPNNVKAQILVNFLKELDIIDKVYLESGPAPPPGSVNFAFNPRSINQGYQTAAPIGIDARFAWTLDGGDGEGIRFVDIESGWTLNHEDLLSKGITISSGINTSFFSHGTNVLGVVVAVDNFIGGVGIAPNVSSAQVASIFREVTIPVTDNVADAIVTAGATLSPGDVLLIENQRYTPLTSGWLPDETERGIWEAIKSTTALGIIVIEPAGNGGINLDTFRDTEGKQILNRSSPDFKDNDSGAIMVGAATSTTPHSRTSTVTPDTLPSNFGNRVDCYAWGENVDTPDSDTMGLATTRYTNTFCCTSAAAAIIAGAALCIQGIVKKKFGSPLSPEKLREILTNPGGTPSTNPAVDSIGIMPNLAQIIKELKI